jgi:predicted thioesterase
MKNIFTPGDKKTFKKVVTASDSATFEAGMIHPVYSTFALARDAEWACRLFVLDMKENHEEGIGTFITVEHLSPALIGETIVFEAELKNIDGNAVICSYSAKVGDRLIARGEQGQKILLRQKLEKIFENIQNHSRAEH